jgi:spore coat polysaccharide biosynthesis protein SpsF
MGSETMKIGLLIQARANSTRLPNKVFEMLGDKMVLTHLIDTCESVNLYPKALKLETKVLIPLGDSDIFTEKGFGGDCVALEGTESDLLTRYSMAQDILGCDAFLRLTADCPLLPKHVIEQTIVALMTHDYVSNTMQRTFIDGHDCQGISSRAFAWYKGLLATEEHLFSHLEQNRLVQDQATAAGLSLHQIIDGRPNILNPYAKDNKLSIDTSEDLERVRHIYQGLTK